MSAAIDHSCKPLNAGHGKPESRADRSRRIRRMVERHADEWNDEEIAEWCGCTAEGVRYHRKQMPSVSKNLETATRPGRDGKKYPASKPKQSGHARAREVQPHF